MIDCALPLLCFDPLTSELVQDGAEEIDHFRFGPDHQFSSLVADDIVPWVRGWPEPIVKLLQQSLRHLLTWDAGYLGDWLSAHDPMALIEEEPVEVWKRFYGLLADGDLSEAGGRPNVTRLYGQEAETFRSSLVRTRLELRFPDALWLHQLRAQRLLQYQLRTFCVRIEDEPVGAVRVAAIRDVFEREVLGRQTGPFWTTASIASRFPPSELSTLVSALERTLNDQGSPDRPGLTTEQVVALEFVRSAAIEASSQGSDLVVGGVHSASS